MTTGQFFHEIARYAGGENRLTGVLAAVLMQVPELGLVLAQSWTHQSTAPAEVAGPTTEVYEALVASPALRSVETQVWTTSGKAVDLSLRFGHAPAPSADDVHVWVEVKHGTHPRENQLRNYLNDLPRHRHAAVILLAPQRWLPYNNGVDGVAPSDVPQRSWQAVGRIVRGVIDTPAVKADAKSTFLLEELYAYMHDESLTEPDMVRPEHLVALAYRDQAEAALVGICERVSRLVEDGLNRKPTEFLEAPYTHKQAYGWDYYEAWNLSGRDTDLGARWLDWNARNDTTHQEADGRSLVFISGLTAQDHDRLGVTQERQVLLENGVSVDGRTVRFQRITDDLERLAQVAFPQEVLIGRTLNEQAESLANWILRGFEAIMNQIGRPPSPAHKVSGQLS